jgi:anti-anti-sigma factor
MNDLRIVEREPQDGIREIGIVGEFDEGGRSQVEDAIARAHAAGAHLLFDLGGCEFLDSTGLGEIVRAHQTASADGRRALVYRLSPEVERLFTLTGLTENGLVVKNREDALVLAAVSDRGLNRPGSGD